MKYFCVLLIILAIGSTSTCSTTGNPVSGPSPATTGTNGPAYPFGIYVIPMNGPASHVPTFDFASGHGASNSPQSGLYPLTSLGELGWVETALSLSSTQVHFYHDNGVHTYAYTDAGYCINGENSFQNTWCGSSQGGGFQGAITNFTFIHDCAGNNLYKTPAHNNWWNVNPALAFQYYNATWVAPNIASGSPFDAYHVDGINNGSAGFLNVGNISGTPGAADSACNPNTGGVAFATPTLYQQTLIAPGFANFLNSPPMLINGFGADNGPPTFTVGGLTVTGQWPALQASNGTIIGGRMECPYVTTNGTAVYNTGTTNWTIDANVALLLSNSSLYAFEEMCDVGTTAFPDQTSAGSQALRLFAYASYLLTYNPTYSAYSVHFGVGNPACNRAGPACDHVYPETQLVPYNAFTPLPCNSLTCSSGTGIAALQDPGGAYEREYKDCFYQGLRVGRCADIVNPQATAVPWPTTLSEDYTTTATGRTPQQMVIHNGTNCPGGTAAPPAGCGSSGATLWQTDATHGAEIDAGGYADFTGGVAPATVPAQSAIIMVDTSK